MQCEYPGIVVYWGILGVHYRPVWVPLVGLGVLRVQFGVIGDSFFGSLLEGECSFVCLLEGSILGKGSAIDSFFKSSDVHSNS